MLGGSALLRVLLIVLAAASGLALARDYLTVDAALQREPVPPVAVAAAPPTARRPAEPAAAESPVPALPVPALPKPALPVAATPAPAPLAAAPARPAPATSLFGAAQASADEPVLPAGDAGQAGAQGSSIGAGVARADSDLLDLNTASLADLNALKGAGAVGRAIVQHRPYAAVEDLLSKRVLSRSLFQRVRGQVTVGDRAAAR